MTTPKTGTRGTRRLTTAQALVAFLARQYTERDGRRRFYSLSLLMGPKGATYRSRNSGHV